jgi:hypothetical protein
MDTTDKTHFIAGTLEGFISVPVDLFEHLLNCLANQKFINDINADALSDDTDYRQVQRETQNAIDRTWLKGMDMLHSYHRNRMTEAVTVEELTVVPNGL